MPVVKTRPSRFSWGLKKLWGFYNNKKIIIMCNIFVITGRVTDTIGVDVIASYATVTSMVCVNIILYCFMMLLQKNNGVTMLLSCYYVVIFYYYVVICYYLSRLHLYLCINEYVIS